MKIGLVVEGGGMKCAYSAGVLDRFLDDDVTFDYALGVSAGSANVASFLGGQRGRNRRFYTDHIKEPMYFGRKSFLRTGNLFNLHYIYADLSNSDGGDPLDFDAIQKNRTEFVIVATDAKTGEAVYFDGHKMKKDDYRMIMASSSLPAACRPTVMADGQKYYDGGVSDSIPVERALADGCDKVVVISSKPRDFVKKPESLRPIYTLLCMRYPKIRHAIDHRHIMYAKCQKEMFQREKEGKAFLFCPSEHLPMSTYAMDSDANQALYDLGVQDYNRVRDAFRAFLRAEVSAAG